MPTGSGSCNAPVSMPNFGLVARLVRSYHEQEFVLSGDCRAAGHPCGGTLVSFTAEIGVP